jgi:hypothetical protein
MRDLKSCPWAVFASLSGVRGRFYASFTAISAPSATLLPLPPELGPTYGFKRHFGGPHG